MTNIAKLLKDAPKGMPLYSPLFGNVELSEVRIGNDMPIRIKRGYAVELFDEYGRYYKGFPDAECLLFPSKGCTWEGWKLPTEPKFKVGDWLVYNDDETFAGGARVVQVQSVDKIDRYIFTQNTNGSCRFIDNHCRLWTIADAEDGDVLALNGKPFIYSHEYGKNYCCIDNCGQFRVDFNLVLEGNCVCPATKQESDLLFSKMREVGYEWDADKKELRKIIEPTFKVGDSLQSGSHFTKILSINLEEGRYYCDNRIISFKNQDLWHLVPKKHYDIANFKVGMPVLVREYDTCVWRWVLYSHFNGVGLFFAAGKTWRQCIPFNDDTKHLLGTTDMPSEEFINW